MKTIQKLIILAKKDDLRYPYLRNDIYASLTAPLRNGIHNLRAKLDSHGAIEGFLTVRVKRAKRFSDGDPIVRLDWEHFGEFIYDYGWTTIEKEKHNLLTTNGRDWIAEQVLTNAAAGSAEQGAQEVAV